jgi:hypothetical protein
MSLENTLLGEKTELELKNELDRIHHLWRKFAQKKLKTVGVENLFIISLGLGEDRSKIERYLKLKSSFIPLSKYGTYFTKITEENKRRLERLTKYGNEPSTLRLYTFLETIRLLGGGEKTTWVSRKQLEIIDHVNLRSVDCGCEFMYTISWLQRRQDPRYAPTKGSISYNLTKTGQNVIETIDSSRKKIDAEVWDEYIAFLNRRGSALEEHGYKNKIEIETKVAGLDRVLKDTVLYSGMSLEPSRDIIDKIDERILMAVSKK